MFSAVGQANRVQPVAVSGSARIHPDIVIKPPKSDPVQALEQTCALFDYARLQKIIEVISKAPFIQITGLG